MPINLTRTHGGRQAGSRTRAPRRNARHTSAVRVLGLCGLLSAILSAAAGFLEIPILLGAAGATMVVGNIYAIVAGRRDSEVA